MQLLTTSEMSKADNFAIQQKISGFHLMNQAGRHVAFAVEMLNIGPCNILVLAGPGNNGGDAFVAAHLLKERGYNINLHMFGERRKLKGDAAKMADLYNGELKTFESIDIEPAQVIIDGLFGSGLNQAIKGNLATLIQMINESQKPIVSIDMPSGINGDTGQQQGVAVKASKTVSFFRPKPGHYLYPGRTHCGDLTIHEIGIPKRSLDELCPHYYINGPSIWKNSITPFNETVNKYHRGTSLIMQGDCNMAGASILAANAALSTGAGRVIISKVGGGENPHPKSHAAIMYLPAPKPDDIKDLIKESKITVALIGPGWKADDDTRNMCLSLLESDIDIIMDAGAISCFKNHEQKLFSAIASNNNNRNVILTPHEGEFAKVFGKITNGKLVAAVNAAKTAQATIVLKGADTIIANKEGHAAININGSSSLATAGTGDVLAGIITGMSASYHHTFKTTCAAVYLHAECANALNDPLIADDLINEIAAQKKVI